ncbi:ead/Ea22-like family protein [Salmonella enterica subsp. salamae]|nr:ead/Ea22-like family protein [Salmonella enterica]ECF5833134.1 ead/Ea22-like family protein [Salmonella enterica subsp. salamae]ECF5994998.1 ead/Ea22-like family protein [Salmonella enterica subsp. salamae]ECG1596862.1 ead/Ea22-like family protein [Salmonella enterica subsp. salamae]ECI5037757.1 ead/Ea22-like family protein [Salmonella enterica subsp. salamae]
MNIDKQALRQKAVKAGGEEWQSRKMPGPAGEYTVIVKGSLEKHPGWTTCRPVADEVIDKKTMDFIAAANPATMLALLDENIQLQREKDAIEAVALALRDDMRDAREKLEAAEKRIAELTDQKATWVSWAENASGMVEMLRLRIAELERSETQLINERDSTESALNDAYKAVMGQAPEWSNWFSFENAIDEIELVCELWRNQTDDVIQFRQRIQELEAKLANPVLLPKIKGALYCPVCAKAKARDAAGIKVKRE